MKALVAALVLAVLAAAPVAAADRGADAMHQTGSFTDSNEVKTADFVATEGAVGAKFELSVRVRRGQVAFKVLRPDGIVETDVTTDTEWSCSLDSASLASHPGTWHVEIAMQNATGRYEMRYTTTR